MMPQSCAWCGRQAFLRFRWAVPPGQEPHPWRPICSDCLSGLEDMGQPRRLWETAPLGTGRRAVV